MAIFAAKSYIGIDLGHHTIKAAQAERTASGWRITRVTSAPTPLNTIKDGVVVDTRTLGEAIRLMMREARMTASHAHIAASGSAVFVRPVAFPKMNEATLRKSIRFEASRYIPGSVEESLISFEVLGTGEASLDALIVAAPKDVVETRVAACELAGLEVETVEIESFAMYRSLIEADGLDVEGTMAMVDIGASTTAVSIIDGGVFAMNRSIPHGGKVLTDALVSYFKLTEEQAEEGKAQLDLAELLGDSTQENPPLRIIQPHVDDLIREVRRSLNYFQSQQADGAEPKRVERLIIAGGGAKLGGLAPYTAKKLGLPAEVVGVFERASVMAPPNFDGHGLEYAVAAGLAMRTEGKPVVKRTPAQPPKPEKAPKPPKPPKKSARRKGKDALPEPEITEAPTVEAA